MKTKSVAVEVLLSAPEQGRATTLDRKAVHCPSVTFTVDAAADLPRLDIAQSVHAANTFQRAHLHPSTLARQIAAVQPLQPLELRAGDMIKVDGTLFSVGPHSVTEVAR